MHYRHPSAIRLVAQPGADKLQYIDLRIIPSWELGHFRNLPVSFLDSHIVARMDPEHPRLRTLITDLVGILDRQPRFPLLF